jgi:error-prone DNA polymerase
VSTLEAIGVEYALLGMSLRLHPMELYRDQLRERGILSSEDLERCKDGDPVRIAGMVVVHQAPPTAKGHHFVTLEDEFGFINVIVRPDVYSRYRRVLRESPLVIANGILQRHQEVINLIGTQITTLRQS